MRRARRDGRSVPGGAASRDGGEPGGLALARRPRCHRSRLAGGRFVKKILVTTDFSELGDLAVQPAAELAKRLGAELLVAHVLGGEAPPEPDEGAAYYKVAKRLYDADMEMERQTLAALEERTRDLGVDGRAVVARGAPVEGILSLAGRENVDLIVISSQGRTGLKRILLGSVAEELARLSPVPVLIWKDRRRRALG
ncbi:MAG: universal stress protein [Planctomycetota bacterium]|nr:MAG: universal stress protein [Planctomycetota bacterium]